MKKLEEWQKSFFILYIGQATSLLSSSAVQFSIIWWITLETGSALSLTIASMVGLLPQAILGPFAGVWIDRYNRKKIMIIADSAVALSSLILGVTFLLGIQSILLVYLVLFIRALGETFHKPALQAVIPQLVPASELTKAGGYGQMINSACTMVGPMLGAFIMSVTSLPYAMLVDVLGATIAVVTLSLVNISKQLKKQSKNLDFIQDMKQGINAFRSNKALNRLAIPMLISTIIFVPIGTMLPLMVIGYFNGTAWHNGIVQTLFSIGMLIAAMLIGITGGLKRQFLMISLSTGLLGICALIGGILPPHLFWIFCIVVFVMGTTGMGFNIPFTSYIQRTVPAENLGKVISLITSAMSFAAPVGMFIAGPISEMIGVSNWMFFSGVFMILIGIVCYFLTREFDISVNNEVMLDEK
ncbi:MFS transporter [Bacillus luteolus]|uniref:MFS transporter n=1 Tax=Litchfieldia luteola TaxID=682179 RepID=A0ABR9QPZ2_9BACI|nr:MFS transporter [Cytobacillus luteolus]MBE4910580.1 MFS transporter [Cytobacillus luteolus]MBP1943757.1 DHA3 family macrolide efflux protein-like MFS transporter [Cytobacillus luteolus]